MKIHPKDAQLLRFVLSIPLGVISMRSLLYNFEEHYKVLYISVFGLALLSFFSSINKTVEIDHRGINLTDSIFVIDNMPLFPILFVFIAILYNPFCRFQFEFVTWDIIHLITALFFSLPFLIYTAKEKKKLRKDEAD